MNKAGKKGSKFPDKSEFAKGFSAGYRKGCADMEQSIKDLMYYGFSMHTLLTLSILLDKYKSSDEDLQQLLDDMLFYEDKVNEGFLTYQQMEETLKDVHGMNFTWKDDLKWEKNHIKDRRIYSGNH